MAAMMPYRYRGPRRIVKNNPADVMETQEYLRMISFDDGSVPLIAVDGIFGPETTQAVAAFQSGRGLPATGRVDLATWDALAAAYLAAVRRNTPPQGVNPFPGKTVSLGPGDAGDAVWILQLMLAAVALRFENLLAPAATGRYEDDTRSAVERFQSLSGSDATGRVDKDTWDMLAKTYESYTQS